MTMFTVFAGFCTFLTLLTTFASGVSGSRNQDDFILADKRFLLEGNAATSNISVEQFASCYLTCEPAYEKLLEACCKTGLSVVCSNLPWGILKPKLGTCTGLLKRPITAEWLSLEQFAACFLTCVVGYEKLTTACCQTGLHAICTNLPWDILTSSLGTCQIKPNTTSTLPQPYWSLWGTWTCEHQGSLCFQTRNRTCSTGINKDCESKLGEMATSVRLCSEFTCPDFFSTTTMHVTTSSTTSVTSAMTSTQSTMQKLPTTDCFYNSNKYMGAYSISVSGKKCLSWSRLDPTLTGFPDESIADASNKCRDPDNRGFPWCYTSDLSDWEFCPVPYCKECFYAHQSQKYEGYVNVDNANNTCQLWSNYVAQTGDTNVKFPNDSIALAKNYCRDPKYSGTVQCFNGKDLKTCDVPKCPHECRDDPATNCQLVQKFVCMSEYTSITLCPKTCNMCKFGLLPPVKMDPPADICVDSPDANCHILQSIICSDPDGALKLCPKTCNMCNFLYGHRSNTQTTTQITSPTTTFKITSPQPSMLATTQNPYWLPWESWNCNQQSGACFQNRFRICSTGKDDDCMQNQGGVNYNIGVCTETACPGWSKTRPTTTQPSTTTNDNCQDDPTSVGCTIPEILIEVCKEHAAAWKLCPRSCGLCDSCWDYLNCTASDAQRLLCKRENYALQYCRKTCGRCDHKPVDVQLNQCGDPVKSVSNCEILQNETCICNDPEFRILCGNYCDNKCIGYPFTGSTCKPTTRKKRGEILTQVLFN